jgi:sugar/nucleoside kinase (ribokinase family)
MRKTIVVVGEALVEVMRPSVGISLDQEGTFAGPFASGAPAIFAVAAARLGYPVRFIGSVGQDAFGRLLRRRLQHESVDAAGLQTSFGHATGVAFVAYNLDGSREFVFHLCHSAAGALSAEQVFPAAFANVGWLHLSGSTLALNEGCQEACWRAVELTKAAGGRVSFDPNLRPELLTVEAASAAFARFIEAADLLLPTASEAQALAGIADDDRAASTLLGSSHKILVYKRGAAGCSVYAGGKRLDVTGFRVEEVDPTGAGDCFNAAFLVGLEEAWPLEQVARFACAAGALAVTVQGPMEGAPALAEAAHLANMTI